MSFQLIFSQAAVPLLGIPPHVSIYSFPLAGSVQEWRSSANVCCIDDSLTNRGVWHVARWKLTYAAMIFWHTKWHVDDIQCRKLCRHSCCQIIYLEYSHSLTILSSIRGLLYASGCAFYTLRCDGYVVWVLVTLVCVAFSMKIDMPSDAACFSNSRKVEKYVP